MLECGIKRVMLASAAPSGRAKKPPISRAKHAQLRFRQAVLNEEGIPDYPRELQEALDVCTDKQRKFSLLVGSGMSGPDALKAVYNVTPGRTFESLAVEASNTLANVKVSRAVPLVAQWLDTNWLLEAAEVVTWAVSNLYDIAEHAPRHSDRLKATELLLRKHGELVDRKVVTHIDGTEADTQEALLKSILADVDLIPALEPASNQLLTEPAIRPQSCPRCGGAMLDAPLMGDGDGI